jgi:hypothetical protein
MAITARENNLDEIENSHFSKEANEQLILKIDFTMLNCLCLKIFK